MFRRIWDELEPKWPKAYWDDWLREPPHRKGRHTIRPEVSLSMTTGSFHLTNCRSAEPFTLGRKELATVNIPRSHLLLQPLTLISSSLSLQFLDEIVINSEFVPFTKMNLNYLQRYSTAFTFPSFCLLLYQCYLGP